MSIFQTNVLEVLAAFSLGEEFHFLFRTEPEGVFSYRLIQPCLSLLVVNCVGDYSSQRTNDKRNGVKDFPTHESGCVQR